MSSIAQIKHIASLRMPKYRQKYGQFVIEGRKMVEEVFHSDWEIDGIWATKAFVNRHEPSYPFDIISVDENKKLTAFDTAPGVLAMVRIPVPDALDQGVNFMLALDGISDPGNMGSIIRLADWFGLQQVIASEDCVDMFNPKCLNASMGSFLRVSVVYTKLNQVVEGRTVYGAFLDGVSIHNQKITGKSMLIVGSESHGIRLEAQSLVTKRITIPGNGGAESLNAAMASAILLDNLLR
ncbi:MAG: RNA methyltransferase [Flavobacteriaceae bacterium]|nr:RNA methyltransferase [Flavobacteriaceae bacterium]